MSRNDPVRNFRFRLEIDGLSAAAFSEATITDTVNEAIDYRDGTDPMHVRKLQGLTKYGNVTLKRGITDSMEIYNWHKVIMAGQIQSNRKQVAIVVVDESGADKARFVISEAWPTKYDPSAMNAKGNEVLIELLELVNEGIERVA
jgi:phage tail-like protein